MDIDKGDRRFKELLECGFPTGSAYWGCPDPKDIDYVVRNKDWERIKGTELGKFYYNYPDIYDMDSFRSFYYNYKGKTYNFIIPNEIAVFRAYRLATKWMLDIPVRYITMKSNRVQLFECFLEIIKQADSPSFLKNPFPF